MLKLKAYKRLICRSLQLLYGRVTEAGQLRRQGRFAYCLKYAVLDLKARVWNALRTRLIGKQAVCNPRLAAFGRSRRAGQEEQRLRRYGTAARQYSAIWGQLAHLEMPMRRAVSSTSCQRLLAAGMVAVMLTGSSVRPHMHQCAAKRGQLCRFRPANRRSAVSDGGV